MGTQGSNIQLMLMFMSLLSTQEHKQPMLMLVFILALASLRA